MEIWHNPRCRKSREGLQFLQDKGLSPEVKEYMKEGVSRDELKEVLSKLNISATDLLRKNEKIYKEEYKGSDLSEDQWIDIMVSNPQLIERPIIINGNKAVIGRPTEKIEEVI